MALLTGLRKGYGLDQNSEIFVVGHSHMMMGVDKKELEEQLGCKISKYTRSGVTIDQRKMMTEQFLQSGYASNLKIALVGVDCFTLSEGGISANSHTLFYPFMDDMNIDRYIYDNTSMMEYYQHKIIRLTRYSDDLINASLRGWIGDDANYKKDTIDMNLYYLQREKWKSKIELRSELKSILENLITELTRKGVHVYLINTPTLGDNNHIYPDKYDAVIGYYNSLDSVNEMVTFIDFNPIYEYNYKVFSDPLHLNVQGQRIITDSIAKKIKEDKIL